VSTDVTERPDTRPSDPGLEEGKVAQMRGYVMGEEVIALCGERFIPTRDPERYPVCEGCKQALTMLRASGGN